MGNNLFHRLEASPESGIKVICLFFLPELVYRIGSSIIDFEYIRFFNDFAPALGNIIPADRFQTQQVLDLIRDIHLELTLKNRCYQLAVKNHLLGILLLIARFYERSIPKSNDHPKKLTELSKLKGVFRFLENRYKEKVNLKDVAAQVYVSPSHFCKVFKRVTGCTLTEYLFRLRIDTSGERLGGAKFDLHRYEEEYFARLAALSMKSARRAKYSSS